MGTISQDDYMNRLRSVIKEMPNESERVIRRNMDDIMDYVREDQMFNRGIAGDGSPLGVYKITNTEGNGRGFPKLRGTRFNLFDSGYFFDTMVLTKTRGKYNFRIRSNASYLKDILEVTNKDEATLLGITEENNLKVNIDIIKKEIDAWILSKI